MNRTPVKVASNKTERIKVLWVKVYVPKFDANRNVDIGGQVEDKDRCVQNVSSRIRFGASDFADTYKLW